MGMWNGTCGITQLPISGGEKCKLIILAQQETNGECYYTKTFWVPIPLVFSGEYDSYGSINLDAGQEEKVKVLLSALHNIGALDINAVDSWGKITEEMHKSTLFYVDKRFTTSNNPLYIKSMLIREEIFELLSNSIYEYEYRNSAVKTITNYDVTLRFENIYSKIKNEYNQNKPFLFYEKIKHMLIENNGSNHELENSIIESIFYSMPSLNSDFIKMHELGIEFYPDYIAYIFLNYNMMKMRKHFSPACGTGSQDGYNVMHIKLIDAMHNIIENKQREFEEEYDGDETSVSKIKEEFFAYA
jgi:hypothetical protein